MREADYYTKKDGKVAVCALCPHKCSISDGNAGRCGVRCNKKGRLIAEGYGNVTALALDPIEKKPLARFYPGKNILSLGSYGCNFHCGFCQNHLISMGRPEFRKVTAESLAEQSKALEVQENIGLAFTYNEPLINIEFFRDCAALIRKQNQKNVIVTNGFINQEPLRESLPLIDAMNIDLKSINPAFYQSIGGDVEAVKRTISLAAQFCHVEVTTLIIAGENDAEGEMKVLSEWIAGIDKKIPLHISRFFPAYQYRNAIPTPAKTIQRLVDVARTHLDYVYPGNC